MKNLCSLCAEMQYLWLYFKSFVVNFSTIFICKPPHSGSQSFQFPNMLPFQTWVWPNVCKVTLSLTLPLPCGDGNFSNCIRQLKVHLPPGSCTWICYGTSGTPMNICLKTTINGILRIIWSTTIHKSWNLSGCAIQSQVWCQKCQAWNIDSVWTEQCPKNFAHLCQKENKLCFAQTKWRAAI